MDTSTIVILDFGSQYTQLIARRIREQRVYCEIQPCTLPFEQVRALAPKAIVLSGGPASVYTEGAPTVDPRIFELGVPKRHVWIEGANHNDIFARAGDRIGKELVDFENSLPPP